MRQNHISELLLAAEGGADLEEIIENNDEARWKQVSGMFEERLRLGFAGKLETKPVTMMEIYRDSDANSGHDIKYSTNGFDIVVPGVTSVVVGLLPYSLSIKLIRIDYLHGEPYTDLKNVKTIRDLVLLIRHTGSLRVKGYSAEFKDYPGEFLQFIGDVFMFTCSDARLMDLFVRQLSNLK